MNVIGWRAIMKYSAPDFEKVRIQVETLFAGYTCSEKTNLVWDYTVPCKGTDNYQQVVQTLTGLGFISECWVNNLG